MTPTREQLIDCAEDLNIVLGLDPPIDTTLPDAEIIETLLEVYPLISPDDRLYYSTFTTVKTLQP